MFEWKQSAKKSSRQDDPPVDLASVKNSKILMPKNYTENVLKKLVANPGLVARLQQYLETTYYESVRQNIFCKLLNLFNGHTQLFTEAGQELFFIGCVTRLQLGNFYFPWNVAEAQAAHDVIMKRLTQKTPPRKEKGDRSGATD